MTRFLKRMASMMLVLMVMVLAIPTTTLEAAPKKLATPRITTITQEPTKKGTTYPTYRIEWKKVKGAAKYEVYCADSWSGHVSAEKAEYKRVATVKTNSVLSRKIPNGWYVKVKAISGKASSGFSKPADTKRIPDTPQILSGFIDTSIDRNAVQLNWKRVKGATGYQTMVSLKKDSGYKLTNVGKAVTSSIKFLSSTPGQTHFFAVRAYTKKNGITYYGATDTPENVVPLKRLQDVDIVKVNAEFAKLLNTDRASRGLLPVTYDTLNQTYASVRAKEADVKFSHDRPCGCSALSLSCPHGCAISGRYLSGECLLMHVDYYSTTSDEATIARSMFTQWKNSPPHYAIMMQKCTISEKTTFEVVNGQVVAIPGKSTEVSPYFAVGIGEDGGGAFLIGEDR